MFFEELQQHAVRPLRMQEDRASLCSNARLLIQHSCALFLHLLQGRIDIVNFEADVMQPFAALLQKLYQARARCRRLDQLNLASTRATHREEGNAYLLGWYFLDFAWYDTERVTVEAEGLLDIVDDDSDVVNAFGHGSTFCQ